LAAAFAGLLSDVDRAALTGELADSVAETVRRAVSTASPAPQLADSGARAILSKPVELDKLYAARYDAAPQRIEPPNSTP
jgi:hypothetical protein